MPTALTLGTGPRVAGIAPIVATLKAQDGTPLKERTVVFIVTFGATSVAVAEITDGAGQARVPNNALPPSSLLSYQVSVHFAQPVTLPDGSVAALSDPLYLGTTATGTLSLIGGVRSEPYPFSRNRRTSELTR